MSPWVDPVLLVPHLLPPASRGYFDASWQAVAQAICLRLASPSMVVMMEEAELLLKAFLESILTPTISSYPSSLVSLTTSSFSARRQTQ